MPKRRQQNKPQKAAYFDLPWEERKRLLEKEALDAERAVAKNDSVGESPHNFTSFLAHEEEEKLGESNIDTNKVVGDDDLNLDEDDLLLGLDDDLIDDVLGLTSTIDHDVVEPQVPQPPLKKQKVVAKKIKKLSPLQISGELKLFHYSPPSDASNKSPLIPFEPTEADEMPSSDQHNSSSDNASSASSTTSSSSPPSDGEDIFDSEKFFDHASVEKSMENIRAEIEVAVSEIQGQEKEIEELETILSEKERAKAVAEYEVIKSSQAWKHIFHRGNYESKEER